MAKDLRGSASVEGPYGSTLHEESGGGSDVGLVAVLASCTEILIAT